MQYEFRKTDPRTGQVLVAVVGEEGSSKLGQYEGWRRVKMESLAAKEIQVQLRQNHQHFVDPDFPHRSSSMAR